MPVVLVLNAYGEINGREVCLLGGAAGLLDNLGQTVPLIGGVNAGSSNGAANIDFKVGFQVRGWGWQDDLDAAPLKPDGR